MTDVEAQTVFANILLAHIRRDRYPGVTHMQLLESIIPQSMVREYLNVLLEKVMIDRSPSIPMLRRIARIVQQA